MIDLLVKIIINAIAVYVATTLICMLSALFSVGKVRRADPAELFA